MARESNSRDSHSGNQQQTSSRTTGGNSRDTSSRPSTRSTGGGSRDTSSSTRSNPQQPISVIRQAVPMSGGVADAIDRSGQSGFSHSGGQIDAAGNVPFSENNNGIAGRVNLTPSPKVDPVGSGHGPTWGQFDDFVSTLTPPMPRRRPNPDSKVEAAGNVPFSENNNGLWGGLTLTPSPKKTLVKTMAVEPNYMKQDAPGDIGSTVHDFLQAPYQRRVDANGGKAPFEGPIDMQGLYDYFAWPSRKRIIHDAAVDMTGKVAPIAVVKTPGSKGPTSDQLQAIRDLTGLNSNARLPSEPQRTPIQPLAFTEDPKTVTRTILPNGNVSDPLQAISDATGVPLPRRRPDPNANMKWEPATPGGGGSAPTGDSWNGLRLGEGKSTPGLVTGPAPGAKPAGNEGWNKTVDIGGQLLSHTGLGSIVSTFLPDLWNAGGDMMKGLGSGGGGTLSDADMEAIFHEAAQRGFTHAHGNSTSLTPNDTIPGGHDTLPGGHDTMPGGDDTTPGGGGPVHRRHVQWPGAGYRPGVDSEWQYFTDTGYADGGIVGYADGGAIGMSGIDGADPRIEILAEAEKALRGMSRDPGKALQRFVQTFGEEELGHLRQEVQREETRSRMISGQGGPQDDSVPARINKVQEAALSDGEFVMPAAAVKGAGGGDATKGAKKLTDIADMLAGMPAQNGLNVDKVG